MGFPEVEVTGERITRSLRDMGVGEGDALIFHSSLSSLGYVVGGEEALIDAVLEAVGPEGTAMVPCLTDITKPFHPSRSPSTVGRVAETFRLRREAVRSRHPTHSVAAIGAAARYLTEGHERCASCDTGSPYEKLCRLEGWVLLIGVDQDRNTTLHTAETLIDVPYLHTIEVAVISDEGQMEMMRVEKYPMGHREFIGLDKRLREEGIVRVGRVGNAVLRLMPARELIEFGMHLLQGDPMAFLCRKPRCISCRWAEARIKEATLGVPDTTDWDLLSRRWGCDDVNCEVCYV